MNEEIVFAYPNSNAKDGEPSEERGEERNSHVAAVGTKLKKGVQKIKEVATTRMNRFANAIKDHKEDIGIGAGIVTGAASLGCLILGIVNYSKEDEPSITNNTTYILSNDDSCNDSYYSPWYDEDDSWYDSYGY